MHNKLDNDRQVFFYEQEFYVLSNFSSFKIKHKDLGLFDTAEHLYHYLKFYGVCGAEHVLLAILDSMSAHEAFRIAQVNKILRRSDWDDIKIDIMLDILRLKVDQHEYVKRKLLETGDRVLIEDSWRDSFWGWGSDKLGLNTLGKLWMQVREEIRNKE